MKEGLMKKNSNSRRVMFTVCVAFIPLLGTGCVTGSAGKTKVEMLPTIEQDDDYENALRKASRSTSVSRDFETKYTIEATYLSPDFRSAFARRAERFTKNKMHFLEESSGKSAFFVTLFSPDSRVDDLADQDHWTIQLTSAEKPLRPAFVRRLADKDRWKNFFPGVNRWSAEYMVVFDTPSRSTDSPEMAAGNQMQVQFTNPDADVTMTW
jgi:hypothetical protein